MTFQEAFECEEKHEIEYQKRVNMFGYYIRCFFSDRPLSTLADCGSALFDDDSLISQQWIYEILRMSTNPIVCLIYPPLPSFGDLWRARIFIPSN